MLQIQIVGLHSRRHRTATECLKKGCGSSRLTHLVADDFYFSYPRFWLCFALLCFAWLACLALTLNFALVVLRLRCVLLFALRCSLLCGLALLYSAVWLCHLPSAPLLRRSRSSAEASIVFCQYSNFPLLQTLSLVASSPNHRPLSENR